jgi:hypothetical protein
MTEEGFVENQRMRPDVADGKPHGCNHRAQKRQFDCFAYF